MTIIDQRFGCELITGKGKVFKFDATECMLGFLKAGQMEDENTYMILTNSFDKPGILSDAKKCYYLRSKEIPSPMGMFISPFTDSLSAIDQAKQNPGEIYHFNDLKEIITAQ
jgi:copper chaperone NosL